MNINERSGGSEMNTEYASQWIEYLKKKNMLLNIVWPLFMCSTIVCAISTFYFYQLSENTKLQFSVVLSSLQDSKKTNNAIAVELKLIQQTNIELEENIALLSNAKTTLEQQKGNSVSQLDLSSQMVNTLKEKIAALETENTLTVSALHKAKSLLGNQEKEKQSTEKNLDEKIKAHNKERFMMQKRVKDGQVAFKALTSRQKEMQSEMNRLADVVAQQKNEINAVIMTKNIAQTALTSSKLKISTLENDYKSLETSLKLAVEPISMRTKKHEGQSPDVRNIGTQKSSVILNSDGLEEIHAPIVKSSQAKKKTNTSAAFDFDQISLDN